MKKGLIQIATAVLIAFSMCSTSVFAKGPINAGGKKADEAAIEWGFPFLYNAMAGLVIAPEGADGVDPETGELFEIRFGTETIIEEDNVTIKVSEIPEATYNSDTGEWEGTWVMLKISTTWVTYKFWLNNAGVVNINYIYKDGTIITDEAREFIFFKTEIGEDGFEKISIQAYN